MDIPTLPSKVPGYDLYIDGFQALRRPKMLQGSNITHVVSVLDWKISNNGTSLRGLQHLHIPLDDVYDSNILSYFPRSNAFIHEALKQSRSSQSTTSGAVFKDGPTKPLPSGVLVHCAMGVSRSATIVIAYLLWHSRQPTTITQFRQPQSSPSPSTPEMISLPPTPLTVDTALRLVRDCRPQVEPNSGFVKQLRMYEAMGCPSTQAELESHKIYRRWMNSREVMDALSGNRAPEMDHISFRDEEDEDDETSASTTQKGQGKENDSLTDRVEALDLSNPEGDDPTEITNPDITLSSPSPAPPALKHRNQMPQMPPPAREINIHTVAQTASTPRPLRQRRR